MYQDIKYFQGLNSLRFFAAYLVVIHHAEQIRLKNGIFNLKGFSLFNNGGIAVSFFFVLDIVFFFYNTLPNFFQYPPLISPQTVALTATAFDYLPPRRLLSFSYLYLVIS